MMLDSAVKDVKPFHHAEGSDVQVLENLRETGASRCQQWE